MKSEKKTVLCLSDFFLPGHRAGGPIRSIANMIEHLGDDCDFRVLTRNHDFRSRARFEGVESSKWLRFSNGAVYYCVRWEWLPWRLLRLILENRPKVLYLNSFWSLVQSAQCYAFLRLGFLPASMEVLIAPRGEFSKGAIAIHSTRKRLFLALFRRLGLVKRVSWHASSRFEADDIQRELGPARILIAPDIVDIAALRGNSVVTSACVSPLDAGVLRLAFIARISPKKNLLGAIETLRGVSNRVEFAIYGPIEDEPYWQYCLDAISRLPPNIVCEYRGVLTHADVGHAIVSSHALFMPTFGENFGHSIAEFLSHGRPVIVSDQTFFRDLIRLNAGWDLPLSDVEAFRQAISGLASYSDAEFSRLCAGASRMIADKCELGAVVRENVEMFRRVTSGWSS